MEKENFDEELKNRIKHIFNDYDDGTADEGWNRLREKYPEKKRRKYFLWWVGLAAALLFMALLFGLFQFKISKNNNAKLVKQQKKDTVPALRQADSASKNYASAQQSLSKKTLPHSTQKPMSNTKKTLVKTVLPLPAQQLEQQRHHKEQAVVKADGIKKTPVKTVSPLLAQTVTVEPKKTNQPETKPENQPKTTIQNDTVFTGIKTVFAADSNVKTAQVRSATTSDSSQKKLQQIIAKTTNPIKKPAIAKKAETVKKPSGKLSKFGFGLFAGVHLNYAKGSNNQLGLGAGAFTDFRVAKNLKLSTGLSLMQNKLSYNQGFPANGQLAAKSFSAAASQPVPVTTSVQTSSLKSMDANLLALDIPVNLTYTFLAGKNSIAVSTGLSSNTFVREVYDYHYAVFTAANTGLAAAGTSMQVLQDRKSFGNFNFAKTLNLAAGFTYPLGKKELQIEPFLKYPLGGLSSQQLKFGSAGINLKIKFQSFKKRI